MSGGASGTVLGTVIRDGAPAERALLISDLHLADGEPRGLIAALQVAAEREAALFVLGDLFDTYISRAQVRVGIWRDVADRFAAASAAGTRIVLLVGNRDFLLGDEFVRASGVELVPGGYRARLGGVDTLLLHGDELCQNDLPYQRAKRWLRHPVTRAIARSLPLSWSRGAARKARARSAQVIRSGDQSRFLPSLRAVEAACAVGAERLVFGHIHRRHQGRIGAVDYRILPAFDEAGVGLWLSAGSSEWLAPAGGDRGAEPGECPWSA